MYGTLVAVVAGSEYYSVRIKLDDFAENMCSCPVSGSCKHMAAVLLSYAEDQWRPIHAIANAATSVAVERVNHLAKTAAADQEDVYQHSIKQEAGTLAEANVKQWRAWFKRCTDTVPDQNRHPSFVQQVIAVIHSNEPKLPAGLEQLFHLHLRLYLLDRTFAPYGNSATHFLGYYAQISISDLCEQVEALLGAPLDATKDPVFQARLGETLTLIRTQALRKTQSSTTYMAFYNMLWRNWLRPRCTVDAFSKELALLAESREAFGEDYDKLNGALAQALMHYYTGNDAESIASFKETSRFRENRGVVALDIMDELGNDGEWERLRSWLRRTEELFESSRGDRDRYFQLWEKVVSHQPEEEADMWDALIRMLPASQSIYEDKLYAYGRFEDWLDLLISNGVDPLELRASELQPAEKHAPDMLLAYYHQAVERYVLQRNRDSYKAAVKLLKRLAKLYTKLKRGERWNTFFEAFTERYSRLRALQEELRKGKLLA